MNNFDLFIQNFKLLHTTYKLSAQDLANLLDFSDKGTIGNLETGRMKPSFDTLMRISCVFCVSIDWLTGQGEHDKPYTDASVIAGENAFLENLIIEKKMHEFSLAIFPYADWRALVFDRCINNEITPHYIHVAPEKSKPVWNSYSLSVRANIIVLLNFAILSTSCSLQEYLQTPAVADKLKELFSFAKRPSLAAKDLQRRQLLNYLLMIHDDKNNKPIPNQQPVFDLKAAIQNIQNV